MMHNHDLRPERLRLRLLTALCGVACLFCGIPASGQDPPPKPDTAGLRSLPDPHPSLKIEDEWPESEISSLTDRERSTKLFQYNNLLRKGDISNVTADKKLLTDVLVWKLSQMTLKKNREAPVANSEDKVTPVHLLRLEILRDISQAGALPGAGTAVRAEMLSIVAREAPKLMTYHLVTRVNGALLLSELLEKENPPVAYSGSIAPLLAIITDASQHDAVRIPALVGIQRNFENPQLVPALRVNAIQTLVGVCEKTLAWSPREKQDHEWLSMRLVETLGLSNLLSVASKPITPEVLTQVVMDLEQPLWTRCAAARALSRLPLDASVNVPLMVTETLRLTEQVGQEFKQHPTNPKLAVCGLQLYFSFLAETPQDRQVGRGFKTQVDSKAQLGGSKRIVVEVFNLAMPLVVPVATSTAKQTKIPDAALTAAQTWLKANTPSDYRIDLTTPNAKKLGPPKTAAPNGQATNPVGETGGTPGTISARTK